MQIERLSQWGVIEVSGEDARTFLQTQLTQDVASLAPDRATLAGYCTAKGRMLGQFVVMRTADRVLMLTHAALADGLVKRLGMFVLRLKCKLRNASADYQVFGLQGQNAALAVLLNDVLLRHAGNRSGDVVPHEVAQTGVPPFHHWVFATDETEQPGAMHVIGWPTVSTAGALPRHVLVCTSAWAEQVAARVSSDSRPFWAAQDIRCALPWLEPENLEAFVPQMVNLDAIGGVSFTKGCYPGQEIVARSHYLGKMKRRMHLATCDAVPAVGADVHASTHPTEAAGRIVNAAADPAGGAVVLFEMSSDLLEGAILHAGTPDGPVLHCLPLPYALPASGRAA